MSERRPTAAARSRIHKAASPLACQSVGLRPPPVLEFIKRLRRSHVRASAYGRRPFFVFCADRDPDPMEACDLAEIEAHITGTEWESEDYPRDRGDEGDTAVILEELQVE